MRARTGKDQRRVSRALPTFDLQHLDTSDAAVLVAGTVVRQANGLRRTASDLLRFVGPLALCREDRRKTRHHRVVAALFNFHFSDAAGEAIAERRGEARCMVRWQRSHQFDHDVPEHIEAHGDYAKFGCFHGEALTVRC